jgi:hypothetical protein
MKHLVDGSARLNAQLARLLEPSLNMHLDDLQHDDLAGRPRRPSSKANNLESSQLGKQPVIGGEHRAGRQAHPVIRVIAPAQPQPSPSPAPTLDTQGYTQQKRAQKQESLIGGQAQCPRRGQPQGPPAKKSSHCLDSHPAAPLSQRCLFTQPLSAPLRN